VILGYRETRTERFARGERIKAFEPFRHQAENRLVRLEVATSLAELAALRGNRLEKLSGDRKGQWSIRINDQWRICFRWAEGAPGPSDVEIVDYH
jgi:proteic killer suppression protein